MALADCQMKRSRRNLRRGQAALMITLSIVPILGMLGLLVDFGWGYFRKTMCMAAAQSAATAAAADAKEFSVYTTQSDTACPASPSQTKPLDAGCLYATQNGFTNGSRGQTVTMAGGITAVGSLLPAYWVKATVSESITATFSQVLGNKIMVATASATAGVFVNSGPCVYVLDPTAQKAFTDTGGSFTSACGIAVDSNASNAMNTTGHNAITMNNGANITVHGLWSDSTSGGCCKFNGGGAVLQNQASFSNPVTGLTAPTPASSCIADPGISAAHAPLDPGTYCAISVSNTGGGSTALTLNTGTYLMKTGSFKVSGGIVNATSGVTLYFPTTGGAIDVTGGTLNLTAPVGGSTDGVAVWEDGTTSGAITGGTSTINGMIYMPSAHLDYTGGPSSTQTIVVDTLNITGGSIGGQAISKYLSGAGVPAGVYLIE